MHKITDPLKSTYLIPLLIYLFMFSLTGCAAVRSVPEIPLSFSSARVEKDLERNTFAVPKGTEVLGTVAMMRLEKGDTLPDVARHFSLGINAISAANPGVDVWVPKEGQRVVLPLSFILPDTPRKGIVVNLATMRLFHYKADRKSLKVSTYPVGVGTEERPTPTGRMYVERKAAQPTWHVPASIYQDHKKKGDILPPEVPPGPLNPLGEMALYLSKPGYLIHGTNKPASIGLKATNGCLRLYPENVKMLFNDTPLKTPVAIVNQPYLIGRRDGVVYLEAHVPLEDSGVAELERIHAKLRSIEKSVGRKLDWDKINKVEAEALGIPVPILEVIPGSGKKDVKIVEVAHPERLYGKPEVPELKLQGWYVVAASVPEQMDAQRIAAIINHQGPQIPARVLPGSSSYRVLAGPFADITEAKEATKRLKFDLEIEGIVMEPVTGRQ